MRMSAALAAAAVIRNWILDSPLKTDLLIYIFILCDSLQAMGIENEEDINKMTKFFLKYKKPQTEKVELRGTLVHLVLIEFYLLMYT